MTVGSPHIPVFDKSQRPDGTFSREDFAYDHVSDTYRCPAGKTLQRYRRRFTVPRSGVMKNNMIYYQIPLFGLEGLPTALGSIAEIQTEDTDRKSTRLNSSHRCISYAVFCLKKKKRY